MSKQNDTTREEQTQEIILGRSDLPAGWLHIDALDMEAQGIKLGVDIARAQREKSKPPTT